MSESFVFYQWLHRYKFFNSSQILNILVNTNELFFMIKIIWFSNKILTKQSRLVKNYKIKYFIKSI